ncbi:tRNA threonylcarbamoyladenosine dehydratase, partial [Candidatus Methanarcanum hacksteinii]|uniref:tRNA threonylcarbamoyladenosine dehydratase n=1 Tax=Candidatus Methanarcanum hacksteinii TaxID=2911857 RepID=UPI0037DDC0C4
MADDISQRTKVLIGEDGVEALRDSYVVLAGVGAVGGYALEGLVRAGVGHIKIIDADVFNDTNLNRQILATVNTIGQPKAIVAIERARSINPDIDISAEMEFVSEDTLPSLLSKKPDVLVDAIDTIQHKVSLLRYAATHDIVTYSSMGAALHMDAEKIRIANIMGTKVCPLASSIRCK